MAAKSAQARTPHAMAPHTHTHAHVTGEQHKHKRTALRDTKSKVTIRLVLNGTVPFFGTPSRCPRERLRNAELFRFQVKVKEM
ncbi:hypothetical protein EVAR_102247_1 [Eumeta japonica]|uniref:Uncharacterized protein n=1 Tax=Eumeta variegata TaxID=151549 RepID=A0A4C1WGN8_EUMVA|nr:hypothetical protein EVAR_102247_1 [Eumeta japonica]